jgi:hypothetical protein
MVKSILTSLMLVPLTAGVLQAQGLRQVPKRFIYVEPVGLLFGMGTVGIESALGRSTSWELRGVGVYAQEDGVELYGGGGGLGLRQYFGGGEIGGPVLGIFGDGVYLAGNNFQAYPGYIQAGFRTEDNAWYFGLGGLAGFRFVSTSGLFFEPQVTYQYLFGPRPLVPGSQHLQDRVGFTLGVAFGAAF